MTHSLDPGKMTSSVDDGILTITRRTYRSGDVVHVIFSFLASLFGILFLWIAIANSTLFEGFVTPIVILALLAYGYFGLTRIVNRRTVRVGNGRVVAKDGPLPQIVRSVDVGQGEYGHVEVRSVMRFTFPPTSKYRLYYVGGEIGPDLFRRLRNEDEAAYSVARYQAFTSRSD
ncbi:MAG: hypothetical protein U9R51_06720 [Actinomycetota bacterium]|nr:hypothetical protein [Actinomycetota bacterium]